MKNLLTLMIGFFLVISCGTQQNTTKNQIKAEQNDKEEWELTVFDSDYESFLVSRARPKSMFTEEYLKSKNSFLVSEWNSLYFAGRYRNVIESSIDYDSRENYGFEFEYRLYQVFAYTSWKYGLNFTNLSAVDRF